MRVGIEAAANFRYSLALLALLAPPFLSVLFVRVWYSVTSKRGKGQAGKDYSPPLPPLHQCHRLDGFTLFCVDYYYYNCQGFIIYLIYESSDRQLHILNPSSSWAVYECTLAIALSWAVHKPWQSSIFWAKQMMYAALKTTQVESSRVGSSLLSFGLGPPKPKGYLCSSTRPHAHSSLSSSATPVYTHTYLFIYSPFAQICSWDQSVLFLRVRHRLRHKLTVRIK